MRLARKIADWVADRTGWEPIKQNAFIRRVAKGEWYFGDGAALVLLLVVLIATGAGLALTYSPNPSEAYSSVRYITYNQRFGWFIRALHYWSAGMMVVMLLWHVVRQILVGGYKFPREATWLIGVGLLFLTLVMSQTGYILRWDERGFYALRVVLHMLSRVPWIGDDLVLFVQGGWEPGSRTLSRLYAAHVIWVPLMILGLTGWHLYLVVHHGITSKRERREQVDTVEQQRHLYEEQAESGKHGERFYPETAVKSGFMAVVVFAVVLVFALRAGPVPLMPEANQVADAFPTEEWWWAWYSALIALLPSRVAAWFVLIFPILLYVGLILLPFADRTPVRGMRRRPLVVVLVAGGVMALLGLTELRMRSTWTGWPEPEPIPPPLGVELQEGAELGRLLFASRGCTSCHSVANDGRKVAIDLARLGDRGALSRDELRNYILGPPAGVAMPSYRGKLTKEELERLVEYVLVAQTFPREE